MDADNIVSAIGNEMGSENGEVADLEKVNEVQNGGTGTTVLNGNSETVFKSENSGISNSSTEEVKVRSTADGESDGLTVSKVGGVYFFFLVYSM